MTDTRTVVQPLDRDERTELLGLLYGYRVVCESELEGYDSYDSSSPLGNLLRQSTLERLGHINEKIARLHAILNYEAGW
jgi:hypothetical protein